MLDKILHEVMTMYMHCRTLDALNIYCYREQTLIYGMSNVSILPL